MALAQRATRVRFCFGSGSSDCVTSRPNTFPIQMLCRARSVSHNGNTNCDQSCVSATWEGSRCTANFWGSSCTFPFTNVLSGGSPTGTREAVACISLVATPMDCTLASPTAAPATPLENPITMATSPSLSSSTLAVGVAVAVEATFIWTTVDTARQVAGRERLQRARRRRCIANYVRQLTAREIRAAGDRTSGGRGQLYLHRRRSRKSPTRGRVRRADRDVGQRAQPASTTFAASIHRVSMSRTW